MAPIITDFIGRPKTGGGEGGGSYHSPQATPLQYSFLYIQITFSSVSKVLLGFLTVSLFSSLILLPAQRFFLRRWYAVYLLVLYIAFIVVVVLTQLGVLFGGVEPDVINELS